MKKTVLLFIFLTIVLFTITPSAFAAAPVEDTICLVIDKSDRNMKVYVHDYVVYSFPVAIGRGNLTPEGEFKIANKIENPWYSPKNIPGGDRRNPFGTRWMGLTVPNTGGYKYGIHGTNNPWSIGRSVSLGCIRMQNKDVEWLFNRIPVGTPVIIQE